MALLAKGIQRVADFCPDFGQFFAYVWQLLDVEVDGAFEFVEAAPGGEVDTSVRFLSQSP